MQVFSFSRIKTTGFPVFTLNYRKTFPHHLSNCLLLSDMNLVQQHFPILSEPALQEEILTHGILREVAPGDVIIEIGTHIVSIPLVIEGAIKVLREDPEGNELFLYYLEKGDTCAMSLNCCMANEPSNVRAIAEDKTKLLLIPVQYMDRWMQQFPSWKMMVMQTYAHRFDELLRTIDLIAFHNMDQRLLKYLEEKAEVHHSDVLNITHYEIGNELGSSREAISRLLKKLEKMEKVKLGRNQITLIR